MIAYSLILVAALSADKLNTNELVNYYWDCDTLFMKGELGGQDTWSCLAVTEELQKRIFKNDNDKFKRWWHQNKFKEWKKRGYIHKEI